MLVSVASFLPIIIVGPISDLVGTTAVIFTVAVLVLISGVVSIVLRGPLLPGDAANTAERMVEGTAVDSFGVAMRSRAEDVDEPAGDHGGGRTPEPTVAARRDGDA
jgi:hypothetical protein